VLDELEIAIAQVGDVRRVTGQQVVDADDRVAAIEQGFREVGADEASGSGDDDAFLGHVVVVAWLRTIGRYERIDGRPVDRCLPVPAFGPARPHL
jgi:hypothetical protein